MYDKICLRCEKNFAHSGKQTKYCSRECADKAKIGYKHSERTKRKIALANSRPHSEERKRHISKAKIKHIDSQTKKRLFKLLGEKAYPHRLIREEIGASSITVYNRWIKDMLLECPKIQEIEQNRIKWLAKSHNWEIWKIKWLKENYNKHDRQYIIEYLGLNIKKLDTITKWCRKMFDGIPKRKDYSFHKGSTQPELSFEERIKNQQLKYSYNKMVDVEIKSGVVWYSIDFVINEKIFVEIQGDYWHANPQIYPDKSKLTGVQRSNTNRDRRKKAQVLNKYKDISYFQIWEYDIKNNTEVFQEQWQEILCLAQNMK